MDKKHGNAATQVGEFISDYVDHGSQEIWHHKPINFQHMHGWFTTVMHLFNLLAPSVVQAFFNSRIEFA